MTYFDLPASNKWLFKTSEGDLYQVSVYYEEYETGHGETITEGPIQIYGETKEKYLKKATQITEQEAPDAVVSRVKSEGLK